MGIYHANLKGFQTQVSLRKLYSFSAEKADSRREQTIETSMTEMQRELSLNQNYGLHTAIGNN